MSTPRTNKAIASAIGGAAWCAQANAFAATILPAIAKARAAGATSYQAVADALNARGIRTVRGNRWHPAQVRRVEART
jgi:hypothetical protein